MTKTEGQTFQARSSTTNEKLTFTCWRYDPTVGEMPPGFRAQTTSQGPVAILPRDDGLHWTMAAFDVALKSNAPDAKWIALPAPAFNDLFEEVG